MFELHITCTKDITKLDLDFADGTSASLDNPNSEGRGDDDRDSRLVCPRNDDRPAKKSAEVPNIPDIPDRPVKIDNILNGLEL